MNSSMHNRAKKLEAEIDTRPDAGFCACVDEIFETCLSATYGTDRRETKSFDSINGRCTRCGKRPSPSAEHFNRNAQIIYGN